MTKQSQLNRKIEPGQPHELFAFRSNGYAWFVVLLLCIASVISFIDRQIINLLVDPIRADLGISDTQISLLQGFAFALFYGAVAVPLGRLVDSTNRKRIIVIGMVLWSIATALCGITRVFWQLFVARMFVGIGEATLSPATFSILADYFPRKSLTRALSVITGSGFLGSGLALMIGGLVFQKMLDIGPVDLGVFGLVRPWQMAFLAVSVPGLLFVIIIWLALREPPRISSSIENITTVPSWREAWRYLVNHRNVLWPVVFGFTFLATMMFSLGAWVPTFFIRTYSMTATEIGGIFGLYFMILGCAGVVSGGLLSDWLKSIGYDDSNMRAGLIAAIAALPFLVSFPLVSNQLLSLVLLAPVIFLGTMPFGAGPSALPLIVPNRLRGQVVALYLLIGNLIGQGGGPWFVAIFTDYILQDSALIRYSISVVCTTILIMGIITIYFGMKPYAQHVRSMEKQFLSGRNAT